MNLLYKICFSALFILGITNPTSAQLLLQPSEGNTNRSICVSTGVAIPLSLFTGKTNFEEGTYIDIGLATQIDFNFPIKNDIAFTTSVSVFRNPINQAVFENLIQERYGAISPVTNNFSADPRRSIIITAGPSLSIPKAFCTLDFKALCGAVFNLAGTVDYDSGDNPMTRAFYRQTVNGNSSFGMDLRAGVSLNISDSFRVVGQAQYFYGYTFYEYNEDFLQNFTGTDETLMDLRTQHFNTVSLTGGLSYMF